MPDLPTLELTEDMRMAEPKPEPELELTADLKELGCPYRCDDPRAKLWLDGFKVGLKHGGEVAGQALRDSFAELRAGK